MKKIIMLIALAVTLSSLGGCFWGYPPNHDRGDDRYDRGDRYDRHDRRDREPYERR